MSSTLIAVGSIACLIAVALGAFGAHGLKNMLDEYALQVWHTAVEYHFYHGLGLILIGMLADKFSGVTTAGWIMLAGIILFSGSLYLLSLTGTKILGAITPLGGLLFMIAWGWVAYAVIKA